MGLEHLPADPGKAEEGEKMIDKQPKVLFLERQELKKLMFKKVLLLHFLITAISLIMIIIILAVLLAMKSQPQPEHADQCTGDWILIRGKCYYYSEVKDTWINSWDSCMIQSSTLVTIDNEQELKLLMRYKTDDDYWIGLSWKEKDFKWEWVNGTSFHNNSFLLPTNPSSGEHAYLNKEGVKSDLNHFDKRYICMKR